MARNGSLRKRRQAFGVAAFALGLLHSESTHATYSLIAVDTESGEMGGFAVSCIGRSLSLSEVVTVEPGVGIVASQGYFYEDGRDALHAELKRGASPSEALTVALSPEVDRASSSSGPSFRQYAALDTAGAVAQHSGADLDPFFGHRAGNVDGIVFTTQGNLLTSEAVLDDLESALSSGGPTLPGRLTAALDAVGTSGGGDSRCAPLSGDSGYFAYAEPGRALVEIERLSSDSEVAFLLSTAARDELLVTDTGENDPESDEGSHPACSCIWGSGRSGVAPLLLTLGVLALALLRLRARSFRARTTSNVCPWEL